MTRLSRPKGKTNRDLYAGFAVAAILFLSVVAISAMLDTPEPSELTPEQLDALQVLGEMLPDSDHSRWLAASEKLYARGQVYVDAIATTERGTAERRAAQAEEFAFLYAESNLTDEYYRRKKTDPKKAADWYITEAKKSDAQLVEDWAEPKGR